MSNLKTKFALAQHTLFNDQRLEIDEDEYKQIVLAKKCLVEAMCIEEKYDIILDNYLEFEGDLVNPNLISRASLELDDFFDIKVLVNRRALNLLSSCRMYTDQIQCQLSRLEDGFCLNKDSVKRLFSFQYDNSLSYRTMETVRNFSQHFELPIESISVSMKLDEEERVALSIDISSSIEHFKECSEFKKAILKEIEELGEKVDIKKMIREYVNGISCAHTNLRKLIKEKVLHYDSVIRTYVDRYKHSFGYVDDKKILGLSAVVLGEDGHSATHEYIMGGWTSRRKKFERKNALIQNLHRRYVTGKPTVKA